MGGGRGFTAAGHAPPIATHGRRDPLSFPFMRASVPPPLAVNVRPPTRLLAVVAILSRRRATTRSHPLADPLLPSGGPIHPASYGWLSCACGAIRFCSARQTAPPLALFAVAQPILSAMFGPQRAALAIRSLPLARSIEGQ